MNDRYSSPKLADLAEVIAQFQLLLDAAQNTEPTAESRLAGDPQLVATLESALAAQQLVGVFNLLEGALGERSWENTGCHEVEFKLLWALRAAFVFGNGNVRKLRGNHQRKTITSGLKRLEDGVFGVPPYFELVEDVVRLNGANRRLGTLVKNLLRRMDEADSE